MSKHVVATVDEIPPGGRKLVTVRGRPIAVFNLDGEFYGLFNRCPHQGGPMCEGILTGLIYGLMALGLSLGSMVSPAMIHNLAAYPVTIGLLAVATFCATFGSSFYLQRVHGWDRTSALLAGSPGDLVLGVVEARVLPGDPAVRNAIGVERDAALADRVERRLRQHIAMGLHGVQPCWLDVPVELDARRVQHLTGRLGHLGANAIAIDGDDLVAHDFSAK